MSAKLSQEYDKDFYAWTMHNAELLRKGKFSEIDIEHVAEEIESMGKSDKRELMHRLAILLAHLLKWQFQQEKRTRSWKNTISLQRFELRKLLQESPSLKHMLDQSFEEAYEDALFIAVIETRLLKTTFPRHCPYSLKQALDDDFLPN